MFKLILCDRDHHSDLGFLELGDHVKYSNNQFNILPYRLESEGVRQLDVLFNDHPEDL
jgi:hypothetical protein